MTSHDVKQGYQIQINAGAPFKALEERISKEYSMVLHVISFLVRALFTLKVTKSSQFYHHCNGHSNYP